MLIAAPAELSFDSSMLRLAFPSFSLLRLSRGLVHHGLGLVLLAAPVAGCEPDDPGQTTDTGEGSEEDSGGDSGAEVVGFLEVGFGETDFTPIEDGGELRVVWGAQGSAMFPMPIRAGGITVPDDPSDYTDERAPILDVTLDVDGEQPGFCGHFKCVANYTMSFDVMDDGTLQFLYVRVIMPDGVDVQSLDGKAAHLRVELEPLDSGTLVEEFDLTIVADPPPF